jgi:hypothetical protein
LSAKPTIPEQVAVLNAASEMIAGNTASILINRWRQDEIDAVQIGLGRVRATLEWIARNEPKIRAALAPSVSEES